MSKKKNYLSNAELKEEILKCITDGYEKAVSYGFNSTLPPYDEGNSESEVEEDNDKILKIGYLFESDDDELKEKYSPEVIKAKEQAFEAIKSSKDKIEDAYKKFNDYLKARQLAKAKNNETNVDEM